MASRAPIYAVVILLVTFGLVFVLVGDSGVSTGVYLPDQPTSTPAPTVGPSPTPLPDPAAENWQEAAMGQLTYVPRPESNAVILHNTTTLAELSQSMGVEPPADNDPYPLLTVLETLRDGFEEQITELGLTADENALDGPAIELVNGVPVSRLHIRLDAQPSNQGGEFPGLDLLIGLIERPNDQIEIFQYRLQATPDPVIYQDFRAWLEANVTELSGAEAEAEPGAEATEEATGETTGETTDEAAGETTDEAAGETAGAAEQPTEEPAGDAAETAPEAAPEAAPAEGTPAEDEPAAAAGEAAAEVEQGPWNEVAQGILMYNADPAILAQIAYRSMPVDEFVTGSGFEMPAEDAEAPMLDLLTQLRDKLAGQLNEQGITVGDETFAGPEETEIAGKPAARLRFTAPPQTLANGQAFPGLDMVVVLVELGDGQLSAIQYTYQGAPEQSVYAEFETWLSDNAPAVTVPAPAEEAAGDTAEEAPGEATEGAAEEAPGS